MSSEHVPPEYSRTIAYGNISYTIYSHSFLDYGKVTFETRGFVSLIPCFLKVVWKRINR